MDPSFTAAMNRMRLAVMVALVALGSGCGTRQEGALEVRIPKEGLRSLAWVRLTQEGGKSPAWSASNLASVVSTRVPAGPYRLQLGFANSNYQPPTEVDAGPVAIAAGATNRLGLGIVAFSVQPDLPDLNLSGVIVRGQNGGPTVELKDTGNTYYFFLPKPLPPGVYDAAIRYARSAGPSWVATGIVVRAGEPSVVTLDSGLALRPPKEGRVTGWSLAREGSAEPWVAVTRRSDNDEPLWRRFMLPPGTYRLSIVHDSASPAWPPETVTVEAGRTLIHTPGPAQSP
jgi:hypothetical protein